MSRHKIHLPPPRLRCPVCRASTQDLFYHSTYRTRDGERQLWRCRRCHRCLSERRGTAFFNLKTPEVEVCRSLDALTRGSTQTAVAASRHHKRDTLRQWRKRAAPQAQAVDQQFVTDLEVRDLELDEQWSFAGQKKAPFAESGERGEVWWHKAMVRESRLLVEQFVAPRTPEAALQLVNASFDRLRRGCWPQISSDGYDEYTRPLLEQAPQLKLYPIGWALTSRAKAGRPRQPKVVPSPILIYGQVVKEREGKRVVRVSKRLVNGPPDSDLQRCSTSLLERQNGTSRSRNSYLIRKSYAFAKQVTYMDDQCAVDKTFYNFCQRHRGLKGKTPAMQQGLTDHVWAIAEVLRYRAGAAP